MNIKKYEMKGAKKYRKIKLKCKNNILVTRRISYLLECLITKVQPNKEK
jgi:hypothetical protein